MMCSSQSFKIKLGFAALLFFCCSPDAYSMEPEEEHNQQAIQLYRRAHQENQDQQAIRWYRRAADQALQPAQYRLANMYLAGFGDDHPEPGV